MLGLIVAIVVVGIVIFVTSVSGESNNQEEEKMIIEVERKINDSVMNYKNIIKMFFRNDFESGSWENYESTYQKLMGQIDVMKKYSNQFLKVTDRKIVSCENLAYKFREFGSKLEQEMTDAVIKQDNYGNADLECLSHIRSMKKQDVDSIVNSVENILDKEEYEKLWSVDIMSILNCVWFYAIHKPHSASDFERARKIFYRLYKQGNIEVFIADVFAAKQIGGDAVLRDKIRRMLAQDLTEYVPKKGSILTDFLYETPSSIPGIAGVLTKLASGLMWMQAYKEEYMVLQYMLENKIQMSAKLQERLHSLSNGGGNAPSVYDVTSNTGKMYLDVAALAWRDEDYSRFFENLSFQEKSLTYSLAVRDEDKELFLTQAVNFPDSSSVIGKLETVFRREYGMGVSAANIECVALSGNGSETMKGILVRTKECEQLGIFVHIGRIGKKLNIKFYTLFIPKGQNIDVQKQQVISMYKKLSPTVSMWESSLKDTILMAMQQLLNQTPASPGGDPNGQRTEQVEF